jgi:hypothetical protein
LFCFYIRFLLFLVAFLEIKSGHFDSSTGSWVEINYEAPSHAVSSDNVSLEKIMLEVKNELIHLSTCGSSASNRASPVNLNGTELLPSSKNSEVFFDEAEIERLRRVRYSRIEIIFS